MAVSRRDFFAGAATLAAATVAPELAHGQANRSPEAVSAAIASWHAQPSPEVIALHRMGFGPRPGQSERVKRLGLDAYIDEQLDPLGIDDSECRDRLRAAQLRISYGAGTNYPALTELRPLRYLEAPLAELWPLSDWRQTRAWEERVRPADEMRVATWIRATYSERQLQEALVDFWHNHFHVNPYSDAVIACTFPIYDRDVIRKHCLGNFRDFLEDVARSAAMLYSLDNVSNRAGGGEGGNENFARELFELHTLGSANYLKFYADRRRIGSDVEGNARGYIDDDIYEAARCFSGWTIADGSWNGANGNLPNTGAFLYNSIWHDTNGKTVLSSDGFPNIPRNLPALADGRRVLDLLAYHRGTAYHLCLKLCRRLISDQPPQAVVEAAVAVWMANLEAADQITKVVRVILLSDAFRATWGHKMKTPFEATVGYLRATAAELDNDYLDPENPDRGWNWARRNWNLGDTHHRLFEWPTPDGVPDEASHWATTDGMLRRWNMPHLITKWWGGGAVIDLWQQTPAEASCTDIVDFWIDRLCGFEINPLARSELIIFLAQGGNPSQAPVPTPREPDWGSKDALKDRLQSMVQLLAMTPDTQAR